MVLNEHFIEVNFSLKISRKVNEKHWFLSHNWKASGTREQKNWAQHLIRNKWRRVSSQVMPLMESRLSGCINLFTEISELILLKYVGKCQLLHDVWKGLFPRLRGLVVSDTYVGYCRRIEHQL